MNQMPGDIQAAVFEHILASPRCDVVIHEGMSVADIMREAGVEPARMLVMEVTLSRGRMQSVIPMQNWHLVRPKSGTHVLIAPRTRGPIAAAAVSAVVATAAPFVASTLFPSLALGSFGLAVATAAVSVVGMLIIRALIPPPSQDRSGDAPRNYSLSGASNSASPFDPFPTVLGRHVMAPMKTASGHSETVGEDIYIRERMTFGYGPIALSELKIGTTDITEFEGVQLEFRNVNSALTLAAMPDLATNCEIIGWLSDDDVMSLYPDDVTEDTYAVEITPSTPVTRTTAVGTTEATIDMSLDSLGVRDDKGRPVALPIQVKIEYRPSGSSDPWVEVEFEGDTPAYDLQYFKMVYIRHSRTIRFPSSGEWDIRLTRLNAYHNGVSDYNAAFLTAIRSFNSGALPSNPKVAEVAIRIKASEQLNGQIDNLNAVVQQLAPVWDGSSWTPDQPVRHPAWIYLRALMGPYLRDPVSEDRIALSDFKAWADDEPHWQCDGVLTGSRRLAEVLDMIAATGRARRGLNDLKFSIVRDGGAGGVVQHFSPVNSWGFSGKRFLDREIHAFRVRCISEQKGWEQDEVIVYNDGYNAANATLIETIEFPGVILDADDGDQGNPWRLGRYHMAVAQLRGEEFQFYSDLDHVVCQMGSKVRVVHDVPLFGIGSGRTTSECTTTHVYLDETFPDWPSEAVRLRIRNADGTETTKTGTISPSGNRIAVNAAFSLPLDPGLLVLVEKTTENSVDLLVTKIEHEDELTAKITALPAAPDVLTADGGTIPDYDPQITSPLNFGPALPNVLSVYSGETAARQENDGSLTPRIAVRLGPKVGVTAGAIYLRLRWRPVGSTQWEYGRRLIYRSVMLTDGLLATEVYDVQIAAFDSQNRSRGWVVLGTVEANTDDNPLPAPTGWSGAAGIDTITLFGTDKVDINLKHYRIYASTAVSTALIEVGTTKTNSFTYAPPTGSGYTRYKIAMVDREDREGILTGYITVSPTGVALDDLATDVSDAIELAQLTADDAATDAAQALLDAAAAQAAADAAQGDVDAANALIDTVETDAQTARTDLEARLIRGEFGVKGNFQDGLSGNWWIATGVKGSVVSTPGTHPLSRTYALTNTDTYQYLTYGSNYFIASSKNLRGRRIKVKCYARKSDTAGELRFAIRLTDGAGGYSYSNVVLMTTGQTGWGSNIREGVIDLPDDQNYFAYLMYFQHTASERFWITDLEVLDYSPEAFAENAEANAISYVDTNFYTTIETDGAITTAVAALDVDLQSQIDDAVADIGLNASAITANEVAISTLDIDLQSQIDDVVADVIVNASAIATNTSAISALDIDLQSQINDAVADIGVNASTIATNTAAISALDIDLQAQIDDVVADVAINTSALVDVDGFATAFAGVTVTTSDGKIAGFKATSWSDPDGSGGGVLELLGDVIAEGTMASNRLVVGLGKNLIENSDFKQSWLGITQLSNGTIGSATTISFRQDGDYSELYQASVHLTSTSLTSTDGYSSVEFVPPVKTGETAVPGYLVKPGNYYSFGAKIGYRRCTWVMRIYWFDSAGVALTGGDELTLVDTQTTSGVEADADPSLWDEFGGIVQAPVGAKYARPVIRMTGVTADSGNRDIHFYEPMFALTHADATELTPYSPPGTTLIDGGRIITETLIVTKEMIVAGAVSKRVVLEEVSAYSAITTTKDDLTVAQDCEFASYEGSVIPSNPLALWLSLHITPGSTDPTWVRVYLQKKVSGTWTDLDSDSYLDFFFYDGYHQHVSGFWQELAVAAPYDPADIDQVRLQKQILTGGSFTGTTATVVATGGSALTGRVEQISR